MKSPTSGMMSIRYQVFVSSTYNDLQEERAEVMQALLELDCMPAGMELFPAANEEQWQWIKRVIDESDYYVVIVGGKYGTVHPEKQISYTEMEYRYATEIGKPIIGFVIDSSISLSETRIEIDADLREKLEKFKALVQSRLCKFWVSSADLGAKVSRSITQLMRRVPATGWVRADQVDLKETEEVLRLRNRVLELERQLADLTWDEIGNPPSDLAREDDPCILEFHVNGIKADPTKPKQQIHTILPLSRIETDWHEVSRSIASLMLTDASEQSISSRVSEHFSEQLSKAQNAASSQFTSYQFTLSDKSLGMLRVQYTALGLIEVEIRGNNALVFGLAIHNSMRWVPTEKGSFYFSRMIAQKRQPTPSIDQPTRDSKQA